MRAVSEIIYYAQHFLSTFAAIHRGMKNQPFIQIGFEVAAMAARKNRSRSDIEAVLGRAGCLTKISFSRGAEMVDNRFSSILNEQQQQLSGERIS